MRLSLAVQNFYVILHEFRVQKVEDQKELHSMEHGNMDRLYGQHVDLVVSAYRIHDNEDIQGANQNRDFVDVQLEFKMTKRSR